MSRKKIVFLLINTGSPDAPHSESLNRYLKQFLMDKHIIDLPFLLRWILVNILIVPRRKFTSAELYKSIWQKEGSPLLINTKKLINKMNNYIKEKVTGETDYLVEYAMAYGEPGIKKVWRGLIENEVLRKEDKLMILPMFPQKAMATTGSVNFDCAKVFKELNKTHGGFYDVEILDYFYNKDFFLNPLAKIISSNYFFEKQSNSEEKFDHLLFSYHGLPESHILKGNKSWSCLRSEKCCDQITEQNKNCYRAQCFATTKLLIEKMDNKIPKENYSVSFQSRLGKAEWIKPYTIDILKDLRAKGVKRLAVACPSFVADCLETLEEIANELKEEFLKVGGEDLKLIPCLNDNQEWSEELVKGLIKSARKN